MFQLQFPPYIRMLIFQYNNINFTTFTIDVCIRNYHFVVFLGRLHLSEFRCCHLSESWVLTLSEWFYRVLTLSECYYRVLTLLECFYWVLTLSEWFFIEFWLCKNGVYFALIWENQLLHSVWTFFQYITFVKQNNIV